MESRCSQARRVKRAGEKGKKDEKLGAGMSRGDEGVALEIMDKHKLALHCGCGKKPSTHHLELLYWLFGLLQGQVSAVGKRWGVREGRQGVLRQTGAGVRREGGAGGGESNSRQ